MNRARYSIVYDSPRALILKDLDDGAASLTNDAEAVVADVATALGDRALFYVDTTGRVDRLIVVDGKFAGFAPGWADLESAVRLIETPPPDVQIQSEPVAIADAPECRSIADMIRDACYDSMLTIRADELADRIAREIDLETLRKLRDEVDAWAVRETGFKLSDVIRAERAVVAGQFVTAEEFFARVTKGARS